MSNRFMIILAACIIGLGVIFVFTKQKADAPTNTGNSGSNSQTSNHVMGAGKKKITLLEYGDFQCPACGAFHPIVKAVVEKHKDDITFQFRNYPLVQIHKNGFAASRAAEAASMQNKFWEMHDLLYGQQTTWSESSNAMTYFESFAQQLNLDMAKFKTDYASSAVNDFINADKAAGDKAGVNSTPTFVLNDKKIDKNPSSEADFEKLIADAINASN